MTKDVYILELKNDIRRHKVISLKLTRKRKIIKNHLAIIEHDLLKCEQFLSRYKHLLQNEKDLSNNWTYYGKEE
jgi:hypothetical protein